MDDIALIVSLIAGLAFFVYLVRGIISASKKKEGTKTLFKRSLIALAVSFVGFVVFGITTEPPKETAQESKQEQKKEKTKEQKSEKSSDEQKSKQAVAQPKEEKEDVKKEEPKKEEVKKEEPAKKTEPKKQEKTIDEVVKGIIYDKVGKKSNTGEKRIIDLQVNDNAGTQDTKDKIVIAKLYADENLTTNMTRDGILMDSKKLLEELFEQKEISEAVLLWNFTLVDQYGNESVDTVLKIGLDRVTADKINWKNFNYKNFENVAPQYFVHPALLKK
ncbi:hypothetical protein [Anoxybacteroides rupiense]|jgi:hypothetical protein|uniref:Uncharacterized protein n=1 Tax=Anoxybacteroides rupiense TaxID=311460 RepID=A0ABD5IWK4_9BACL|nr:hypothetical protein [Anoxybacillus rupiensis]MED5052709.1 hypothetical protein [Anoxybacillus rupiensis]